MLLLLPAARPPVQVRKLEFILAEAMARGHDSVVTIGGIQSNHTRATAVAARYLGLPCHLVLRNAAHLVNADPGLAGNLLVERLIGAHIWQVGRVGWVGWTRARSYLHFRVRWVDAEWR